MNIKLIGNGTVITDLFGGALIEDGAVAFDGGKIIAVGKKDDIRRDHSVNQFIDARGGYIMPGLIDAHLHITSPIISSLTVNDSGSLPLWFSYSSNEKQLLKKIDLNTCRALALASAKDCIQNGITSAFVLHSSPNCIKGSLFLFCIS